MAFCLGAAVWAGRESIAGELETVKVGVCLSFTGEFAPYGHVNFAGMRLFVDDFNSRASENGFRIQLAVRDDESNPGKAAEIVDELAAGEGIQIIAGAVTSNIMLAMIERAKIHKTVLISPAATSPEIGRRDDWAFKVLPGDDSQGRALAKFFANQMGVKRAAVVVNDFFVYGHDTLAAFTEVFQREGGVVVAVERYAWNSAESETFDFGETIGRLSRAVPEVVLLTGYAKEAVAFIRQTEKTGWKPIFCGGDSWLNTQVVFEAGERLDDSYYVGGAEIYLNAAEAKRFVELMDKSDDANLETYSVNGYDVMTIIAEALKSGNRSALAVRERLYNLKNFPLVSGKLMFDRDQDTGKTLYIYRIAGMKDGFYSEVVAEVQPD